MEVQNIEAKLPENQNRIEIGLLQINDDHPGTFIRGDDTAYYAFCLRTAINESNSDAIVQIALESLLRELEDSDVRRSR